MAARIPVHSVLGAPLKPRCIGRIAAQVSRLERQLAQLRKDKELSDGRLLAAQRRLETLAVAGTESHLNDIGYWSERSKRSEFAQMVSVKPGRAGRLPPDAAAKQHAVAAAVRRPRQQAQHEGGATRGGADAAAATGADGGGGVHLPRLKQPATRATASNREPLEI